MNENSEQKIQSSELKAETVLPLTSSRKQWRLGFSSSDGVRTCCCQPEDVQVDTAVTSSQTRVPG